MPVTPAAAPPLDTPKAQPWLGLWVGGREIVALRRRLVPAWAVDARIDGSTINALAETVEVTAAFRAPVPLPQGRFV